MNIPPASSLISFESQDKDNKNNRYSGKYFADNLPPLPKKRNGKHVAKTPLKPKHQQLAKTEWIKPLGKFQDEYHLRIPEKLFQWLKGVEDNPPETIPGFKLSHLLYFLHLIASRVEDDGYSRLVMKYLRRIDSRAGFYTDFLINQGIIKRTSFKEGQAFGYKILDVYDGVCLRIPLDDPKMLRKIRKVYDELNKENNQYPTQCRLIESLTIDPEAENFARATYTGKDLEYALHSINNIQNKHWVHIVDDAGKRFHSNITNQPKELRKYDRVRGRPFVANVDVSNSLPVFAIKLLTDPEKCLPFAQSRSLRNVLKNLQILDNEDIKRYKKLTISGELYEFLWDEFFKRGIIFQEILPNGKHGDRRYEIPDRKEIADSDAYQEIRQDIKTMVLKILFDCNREDSSKAKQVFKKFFPTVDEIFSKVRGDDRCENRFENYKRFSILLQNMESHVILKMILKRVYKEGFTAIANRDSALTVHDSLLVTDNAERIAEIMAEELQKFLGFQPKIKIELL